MHARENALLLGSDDFFQKGVDTLVKAFLDEKRRTLDPPDDFRYAALKTFLQMADPCDLKPDATVDRKTILMDDRRDPNGGLKSTRLWDDEGPESYMSRPTMGDPTCIFQQCLTDAEFMARAYSKKVRRGGKRLSIC